MYSLGLGKDACLDFLRKQVDDASLSKGHFEIKTSLSKYSRYNP